jgi:hypothetical protein
MHDNHKLDFQPISPNKIALTFYERKRNTSGGYRSSGLGVEPQGTRLAGRLESWISGETATTVGIRERDGPC